MRDVSRILASALAATVAACSTSHGTTPDATVDSPASPDAGADAFATADGSDAPHDPCAPTVYTPLEPNDCDSFLRLPCGMPSDVVPRNDCFFSLNDCDKLCGPAFWFNCHSIEGSCADGGADGGIVVLDDGGGLIVDCTGCLGGPGRVPDGLLPMRMRGRSALGLHFARAAYFEDASVVAFERLAHELAGFGAPQSLIRAARQSARDEARHTRAMAHIARRFGVIAPRARVAEPRPRSLHDVAIENAVSGCVDETYAALEAAWQGRAARDPAIARSMRSIARDEARHARLAWAVARFAMPRLDRAQREHVRMSVRTTIRRQKAANVPMPKAVIELGGHPNQTVRNVLLSELDNRLWRRF